MAALLARLIRDGHPIAGFAPAVSDLEELFLQVTESRESSAETPEPGAGGLAA